MKFDDKTRQKWLDALKSGQYQTSQPISGGVSIMQWINTQPAESHSKTRSFEGE